MKAIWIGAAIAAALSVTACGGGGGSGDNSGASSGTAPPTRSTALADTVPPAGTDYTGFAGLRPLRSVDLLGTAPPFTTPQRAYVSLSFVDADGELRQLAFLRLAALQALDARGGLKLDLPRNVNTVQFEVYDRERRLTGEIAR